MSLNIKNERVHRLAREAARATGGSQTSAIEQALELLLREQGVDPTAAARAETVDRVRSIVADYVADPGDHTREIRRAEDLYDEQGLPR